MKAYACGAIIVAVLLMGALWATSNLSDARANAEQAASDLESCRAIVARINVLKKSTVVATTDEIDQVSLQRRGEDALRTVGLSPSHLVQVAPDVPRTLGHSAFQEMPTHLTLRDVTLRQTVQFLLAATGDSSPLQARALRLSSPHQGTDGASADIQWTAELTISYLTYQPASASNVLTSNERDEGK